jgi:hypothetical protein
MQSGTEVLICSPTIVVIWRRGLTAAVCTCSSAVSWPVRCRKGSDPVIGDRSQQGRGRVQLAP